MKLFISPDDNKIYTSEEPFKIKCFTEYRYFSHTQQDNFENIPIFPISTEVNVLKGVDVLFLIPNTHINNLWHLMIHLFITYKCMVVANRDIKHIYPIFFQGFYSRNNNSPESIYRDILFTGMGFDYEVFSEIHDIFKRGGGIEVNTLDYASIGFNFHEEPLFHKFQQYIMKNMNIYYTCPIYEKRITFLLRRGSREIVNIQEVKAGLSKIPVKIHYIYLEDYSVKEQLEIVCNTHILIGVHGAGLTWGIFMKPRSIMIEMFPGNSTSTNYKDWCRIANLQYNSLAVSIHKGAVEDFRNCTVVLNAKQIAEIKRKCLLNQ